MRRGLVIAAGWVAAVVAATVAGVASVSALDGGGDGGGALSQQDVADRLAQSPEAGASTGPSATAGQPTTGEPSTGAAPARRFYTTSGGSLWVSCAGDVATLDTITPRSGYRIDGSAPGPAVSTWVKFKLDVKHGHGTEYLVTVTCPGGAPNLDEAADN